MPKKPPYLKIRTGIIFIAAALCLLLTACGNGLNEPFTRTVFAMDTVCSITVYTEKDRDAQSGALSLLSCYEKIFSRTSEESELYRLNQRAGTETEVSDELYDILESCLSFCELSRGAFDISMGQVSALYDFSGEEPRVPSDGELSEALTHTGYEKIHLLGENRVLAEDPELVIDLGAAAKGYTADRLREYLLSEGVSSAIINLGGNVLTLGTKPSGEAFRVGILRPEKNSSEALFETEAENCAVATSGVYQRSFEKDGVLYHHLLDPETGKPVQNGILSVSVIAESSLEADILSTTLFILGREKAEELLSGMENIRVYFIDEELTVSELTCPTGS